ncbi:hypothetical protein OIU84_028453 [Salix udensis]|uniref:Uncharacterized protein n=1 Tax=Salix udensis TaxID=889485 RepID=A0AAD6P8L1_9ROSI|nr:hypothetical protein OIU84_028453 [Salix udensis]
MYAICPLAALVSSSCSTDETSSSAFSRRKWKHQYRSVSPQISPMKKPPKYVNKVETSIHPHHRLENNHVVSSTYSIANVTTKQETVDEADSGNSDIIYSQDLIIRDLNLPAQISSPPNNGFLNFKRLKRDFDYGNQDMVESVKEEKRRKQMEAVAEDLFNTEKGRRRGVAGSLHGLLTHG